MLITRGIAFAIAGLLSGCAGTMPEIDWTFGLGGEPASTRSSATANPDPEPRRELVASSVSGEAHSSDVFAAPEIRRGEPLTVLADDRSLDQGNAKESEQVGSLVSLSNQLEDLSRSLDALMDSMDYLNASLMATPLIDRPDEPGDIAASER